MSIQRVLQGVGWGTAAWLALAGTAQAQQEPFRVITAPWVATRADVPHDAVDQQWHYFQAVGRGGNCANVEYRWDFNGDGTWDSNAGAFANAQNRWNMGPAGGMKYTYPAQAADRLFVARVEGRCGAETDTAEFPIRVRIAPTRAQRLNRSVSNGLWYGHLSLTRDVPNKLTYWTSTPDTALMAQAFMNRGHRTGADPETDPYYEDALWMVNFLLQRFVNIPIVAGNVGGVTPDVNGNGVGLKTDRDNGNYFGGPHLEAISSWGNMDYIAPANAAVAVRGRRLGDVVQDAAEYFMWAQTEILFNGSYAGGWDYSDNSGSADSSQVGWAAVGLFSAQVNGGATVPDWVKARTLGIVAYNDSSRGGNAAYNGSYGYRSCCDAGSSHARSGAMLNALGFALTRNRDNDRVRNTVAFIGNNFDNNTAGDPWGGTHLAAGAPAAANYYALYQITKGMRSFGEPIRLIGNAGIDWYARYSDFLIRTQNANGAWLNDNQWMGAAPIVHALGLLIAIPTIFETPPVAVAEANPVLAGPGDEITFGHALSYAADPSVPLTTFRWNFIDYPLGLDLTGDADFDDPGEHAPEDTNGNGTVTGDEIVWDFETDDPAARPTFTFNPPGLDFGEEVQYRVTLQVVDRLDRKAIDDESVHIRVSIINHPPVALPHPSGDPARAYDVVPGRTYRLDGSQSYDPDSDDLPAAGFAADTITSFGWDTNGDGTFEVSGAEIDFPVPANWEPGENRSIQFKVCDDGQWVGTLDAACPRGDCTLCSERSVRFSVVENGIPLAVATPDIAEMEEGGSVTVSAAESSDPEGGPLTVEWSCDEELTWSVDEAGVLTVGAGELDAPVEGLEFLCFLAVYDDLGAPGYTQVTVRIANASPSIDAVDLPETANEGEPIEFSIAATDAAPADAAALSYGVDCDGDGVLDIIDAIAPVLECSWADEGVFTVTVITVDDDGGVDVQDFVIEVLNVSPQIDEVICPAATEGTPVAINLRVRDPGVLDIIRCALAAPVPTGAGLNDCLVIWTPTYAQAVRGLVDFAVTASDGDDGEGTVRFQCRPQWLDEDGDGLADTWEDQNGVDDPTGDPDGDGLTNQDEFDLGTDPQVFDGATPPILLDPVDGVAVDTTTPPLVLRDARDNNPRGQGLRYEYQLYSDSSLRNRVTVSELIPETPATTAWEVPAGFLVENQTYWWTARATNGLAFGNAPSPESFVINAQNEAPSVPHILRPEDGDTVASRRPTLVVDNGSDADPGDTELTLECEVASDDAFADVALRPGGDQSDEGSTALPLDSDLDEHTEYFARCRTVDPQGLESDWSETVAFTIDTGNLPPTAPVCLQPALDAVVRQLDGIVLVAGDAGDAEGDPLTYRFELSSDPTFPGAGTITSQELPEGAAGETSFAVDATLQDNTFYFYRVRARDGRAAGPSCTSRFRVDLVNEPPSVPTPINPWIDTVSEPNPRFVWAESTDPEDDPITYEVILYSDAERLNEVWRGRTAATLADYEGERLPGGDYWWQVRSEDNIEGHTSEWSRLIHFIVPGSVDPRPDAAPPIPDAFLPPPDAAVVVDAALPPPDGAAKPDVSTEPTPDALEPDALEVDAVEADVLVVERDAAVTPEKDMADPEPDGETEPEPDAELVTEDKQISRSVSGAGCTTAAPGQRGTSAALGLFLAALAVSARRRRR